MEQGNIGNTRLQIGTSRSNTEICTEVNIYLASAFRKTTFALFIFINNMNLLLEDVASKLPVGIDISHQTPDE